MKLRSRGALTGLMCVLLLSSARGFWEPSTHGREARTLVGALPEDALLVVEAPGLAALLAAGTESELVQMLSASPTVAQLLGQADPSLNQLLEQGSEILGTPLLPRLASLLDGGLAIGMTPSAKKLHWTVVAKGADERQTEEGLLSVLQFVGERAGFPRAFDRPHDTIEGADVWYIGEEFGVAREGAFLVASTSQDLLRDTLAALPSTTESADGQAPAVRVTLHAEEWLARASKGSALGRAAKLREFRAAASKPLVQFLLGPELALLTRSSDFRAELFVDGEDLRLELEGSGIESGKFAALMPGSSESFDRHPPQLSAKDNGASLLVYRDIDALFEFRADLFPVQALPKFAEAISNLTLFLGGLDLTEEVLPGLSPWMRLVAEPVSFDEGARPAQPLPAACLLVEVADRERLGSSLVAAFQSAISLTNIERAQQAKPPFLLGIELVEGVELSKARYLLVSPENGVDMEYNLAPACALVGSTFVLGTHKDLVTRVVRELVLERPETQTPERSGERLEFPARLLHGALAENASSIMMSKVLEDGVSKSAAKAELDIALGLIELMHGLRLNVSAPSASRVAVELQLDLRSRSELPESSDDARSVTR